MSPNRKAINQVQIKTTKRDPQVDHRSLLTHGVSHRWITDLFLRTECLTGGLQIFSYERSDPEVDHRSFLTNGVTRRWITDLFLRTA
ncbi:hypothetical protein J6590_020588 [Homalodisca vitripennis]|nr:hypothetical protein J6590_020588 [Homalodisca vitripennis]